jgi:hypothetical protein
MPIFRVQRHAEDAIEITIASGSMPRREPVWEEPNRARNRFTSDYAGGEGETGDGHAYASLGGGVRRWRQAVQRTLSAEERRDVALAAIDAAREHLRMYPASCAARIRREDAFDTLYEVMAETGLSRAEVDATYRTLEEYVFSALVYDASRTCCWNSSTAAMHEIIMDYAQAEQAQAEADGMCVQPTVFRAHTDGYERWRAHAESLGRGGEWVAWSEDESCSQRDVPEDTVDADRAATGYCSLGEPVDPPDPVEPSGGSCDPAGGATQAEAVALNYNSEVDARVCSDESDWFRVDSTGQVEVQIRFSNDAGDLDLEAVDADGAILDSSTSVSDEETVTATGPFFVRVYGYSGAQNDYTIVVR